MRQKDNLTNVGSISVMILTNDKLNSTTDQEIEEQNEIAEFIFGKVARRDGKPMDTAKSNAWQRGWAEPQE